MCIEEAMRLLIDRLAMARLMTDLMALHPEGSDARSLSGLADTFEEMATLATNIKRSMPLDALDGEVRSKRH